MAEEAKWRIGYSGGHTVPYEAGRVRHTTDGEYWKENHTVTVDLNQGYEFDHWEFNIPDISEFGATWVPDPSTVTGQSGSQTINWSDPDESDGGFGWTFIAVCKQKHEPTGKILYDPKNNKIIYGSNGTILYDGN